MNNLAQNSHVSPGHNRILDHIENLEIIKDSSTHYQCVCPQCGGKHLTIEKKEGKYKCWTGDCDTRTIYKKVVPSQKHNSSLSHNQVKRSVTPTKSTSDQPKERVKIAYLPIPVTDSPKTEVIEKRGLGEVRETIYPYSDSKWTTRTEWLDSSKAKGHNKKITPWHLNAEGKAVNKKGEEPWPPYRLEEAIQAAKKTHANAIMGAEGEKSVEQYRKIGIACTTFMGSSWSSADCKQLAETLKKEGLILIYHPDNDEPGKKKARKIQDACSKEGVECVVLNPKDLDEGVPEAGDIVDIIQTHLDIEAFIQRLEVSIKIAREKECGPSLEIDNLIPDSFSPNENCEQQVFNILYKDHPYACVDGILYRWESNYYQAVDESMEKKRIRDILNTLPKRNKNGDITYPFATYAKVNDCLNWAKVSFGVSRQDVNPHGRINCTNGVLSFEWGTGIPQPVLLPHDPAIHFFTAQPLIEYRPNADPTYCNQLLDALGPLQQEIFLKIAGSSLALSEVRKRMGRAVRAVLALGMGENGKDSLRLALSLTLGTTYMTSITLNDFQQYDNGRKFSVAKLAHSRCNWSSENQSFVALDKLQSLKAAITGDPIEIESKHQNGYEISPNTVFFFNINEFPNIKAALEAIKSRYMVLSFEKTFKDNPDNSRNEMKADPRFKYDEEFLKQEVCPSLLNKMIFALQDLIANGIDYSCTEEVLLQIQSENSHLFRFAQEVGLSYIEDGSVSAKDIWKCLEVWYMDNGTLVVETDNFGKEQRRWIDQPKSSDKNIKGPNQVIRRFLELFPKAKRVNLPNNIQGISGLGFLDSEAKV